MVRTPAPHTNKDWGVLLLAHGAPERLEDIPEFLLNVRGGRKLPEAAEQEIIRRYSLIDGGSPLRRLTNLQADALSKHLTHPVYVGMRNWRPFIAEAVTQISADRLKRLVALCLTPQNSRTSIGLYKNCLLDATAKITPGLQVDFIPSWHDHPGLIAAFCEKVLAAMAEALANLGAVPRVIFTAHSVPARTIAEGDSYERQARETAALVAQAAGLTEYRVGFQSQGMTPEPWIGPTVESQIDAVAAAGHRHVLLVPIGFVADHVEILYDIDVAFRDYGKSRGVSVRRTDSLNDSPLFIQALADIVTQRVGQAAVGSK